jgi:hypothetical protein
MNHRRPFVAFGATSLISAFLFAVAGCGDYSNPNTATGGSSGTATGGTGGTAQGGSGAAAGSGQGGSGGMTGGAPTGGAAGSGTGGSAGAAGGGQSGAGGMSGSGGGAACTDAEPCGGDLTGTWTVQACSLMVVGMVDVTGLGLDPQCTMGTITAGSLQITGSLTFNADMTFTDATTMTGEVTFELGPRCLILSGTETTCEGLNGPVSSVGYKTPIACTPNSTTMGCTCVGVIEQMGGFGYKSYDAGEAGNYMAMGNEAALTWFGDPIDYSYCVAGSTLTMSLDSIPKTGTVDGPIVLQKQ